MNRILACLAFALTFPALAGAASLVPQITAKEQTVYAKMLEKNAAQAKTYLDARKFLSVSRQVVANPGRAIDLPVQPESFQFWNYLTSDERAVVDKAVDLNIAALSKRKH